VFCRMFSRLKMLRYILYRYRYNPEIHGDLYLYNYLYNIYLNRRHVNKIPWVWTPIFFVCINKINHVKYLVFVKSINLNVSELCRIHLSSKLGRRSDDTIQSSEESRTAEITRPSAIVKWEVISTSEYQWTCGSFWPPRIQRGA
jgi:hypothetical protein